MGAFKFLWDVFQSLLIKIFAAGVSLLITLLITNNLSAQEAGVCFLIMGYISFLSVFSRRGLENIALKESGKVVCSDLKEKNIQLTGIYHTVLKLSLKVAFPASVAFALLCGMFGGVVLGERYAREIGWILYAMAIPVLLDSISANTSRMIQGKGRVHLFLLLSVAQSGFYLLFLIFLYFFGRLTINHILIAMLLSYIFYFCASIFTVKSEISYVKNVMTRDKNFEAGLISEANVLWWVSILVIAASQGGNIIVGIMLDPEYVSYYSVCLRIATFLGFLVISANSVSSVLYTRCASGGVGSIYKAYKFTSFILMAVSLPLAFVVFIFSEDLLSIFGEEYALFENMLKIMVAGQIINISTGTISTALVISNNSQLYKKAVNYSSAIAIGSMLLFIPIFGVIGAGISYALGMAVRNILSACWFRSLAKGSQLSHS